MGYADFGNSGMYGKSLDEFLRARTGTDRQGASSGSNATKAPRQVGGILATQPEKLKERELVLLVDVLQQHVTALIGKLFDNELLVFQQERDEAERRLNLARGSRPTDDHTGRPSYPTHDDSDDGIAGGEW